MVEVTALNWLKHPLPKKAWSTSVCPTARLPKFRKSRFGKIPTLLLQRLQFVRQNDGIYNYFNFDSIVIKRKHKVQKSPIFYLYFIKYFEIVTFKHLKKPISSKEIF